MTDADYADDLALLANKSVQTEYLLDSLKQAARCFVLYVNADKTEFICFKKGVIFTLSGKPLKFIDQFTYLGRSISSTESDVNICIGKVWIANDRLSVIRKSDLSYRIKRDFFFKT